MLKIGSSNIKKIMIGNSVIKKIMIGSTKVWENWSYIIGNFYDLTSNTAPSPFVASMITGKTSGEAWNAFDDNTSTGVTANYFASNTLGLGVKLLFGKLIRIAKLKVRGGRSGQSTWMCSVYGIKDDNTKTLIYQGYVTSNSDVTITSTDQVTEFKGLECYIDTRTDLICGIYSCQVTEYYDRG